MWPVTLFHLICFAIFMSDDCFSHHPPLAHLTNFRLFPVWLNPSSSLTNCQVHLWERLLFPGSGAAWGQLRCCTQLGRADATGGDESLQGQGPVPHTLPKCSSFSDICSLKGKPVAVACVVFGKWGGISRLVYFFLKTAPPLKPLSKMLAKSENLWGSITSLFK